MVLAYREKSRLKKLDFTLFKFKMREKASLLQSAVRLSRDAVMGEGSSTAFQLGGRNLHSMGWRSNAAGPTGSETEAPEKQQSWHSI